MRTITYFGFRVLLATFSASSYAGEVTSQKSCPEVIRSVLTENGVVGERCDRLGPETIGLCRKIFHIDDVNTGIVGRYGISRSLAFVIRGSSQIKQLAEGLSSYPISDDARVSLVSDWKMGGLVVGHWGVS